MNRKYVLQQLVVAGYVAVTIAGFSYTMLRYWIPTVPRTLAVFSYGMMAPYQSYRTYNEELVAEGRASGNWERIDLRAYMPFIRGERLHRGYLVGFHGKGQEYLSQKYREFARQVMRLESAHGRQWQSVRLRLEKWPVSPAGFEYLRQPEFIEITSLVQVP